MMWFFAVVEIIAFTSCGAWVPGRHATFDAGIEEAEMREIVPLNEAEVVFYPEMQMARQNDNSRAKRSSGSLINLQPYMTGHGTPPVQNAINRHRDPLWHEDEHHHIEGGSKAGELVHDVENMTSREIDVILQTHNDFRRRVTPTASNMRLMHWNTRLADVAAAYVSQCIYAHSDSARVVNEEFGQQLGENIYIIGGGQMNLFRAIKRWYDEIQHYDRQTGDCRDVCGHYTQVVWAESDEIGCAFAHCRGLVQVKQESWDSPRLLVCNYLPAGNERRGFLFDDKIRAPYKIGEACSQCQNEDDACHEGLCDGGTSPGHTSESHQSERRSDVVNANVADYHVDESLQALGDFPESFNDYNFPVDTAANDIFFRNITEFLENPDDLFPVQIPGQTFQVVEVVQEAAKRLPSFVEQPVNSLHDVTTFELSTIEINDILSAHNIFRSGLEPPAANVRRMHWSVNLADDVMKYIAQCTNLQPNRQGDNIKVSEDNWAVNEIIEEWTDGQYGYNWEEGICMFGSCSQYTQIVWDISSTVGCAKTQCQREIEFDGELWERPFVFVCRYEPVGNTLDLSLPWFTRRPRLPYTIGEPCSLCDIGEVCVDNMCDEPGLVEPEVPGSNLTRITITSVFADSVTAYDDYGSGSPVTGDDGVSILPCLCENGGQCVPDLTQATGLGAYECRCRVGFSGRYCNETESSCPPGLERIPAPGADCTDINECLTSPCYPGVECYNVIGSYICGDCPAEMYGDGIACEQEYPDQADYGRVPFPPDAGESQQIIQLLPVAVATTAEVMVQPDTTSETTTPPTTQPVPITRPTTTQPSTAAATQPRSTTTEKPTTRKTTTTTKATTAVATTNAPTTKPVTTTEMTTTTTEAPTTKTSTAEATTTPVTTARQTTKAPTAEATTNIATTQPVTTSAATTTTTTVSTTPLVTTSEASTTTEPTTTRTTTKPARTEEHTTLMAKTTRRTPAPTSKNVEQTPPPVVVPEVQPLGNTTLAPVRPPALAKTTTQATRPPLIKTTRETTPTVTTAPSTTTRSTTTTQLPTTTTEETTTRPKRRFEYKMRKVMKCRRTKAGKVCIPVMRRTKYFKDTKEVMIGGRPLRHYIPRGRNSRIKYNCQKKCGSKGKCQNNGMCNCLPKYAGRFCERSSCDVMCKNSGVCVSRNKCVCVGGYTGKSCENFECKRPCENGGECVAPNECKCPKGYGGEKCQTPLCSPQCENGGKCEHGNVCSCSSGYIGDRCLKVTCKPECQNGGVCTGKDVCSCPPMFIGNRCRISVCVPQCLHGGRCVKGNKCMCRKGWSGNHCLAPICMDKCANGGVCVAPNKCKCREGWSGSSCRTGHCERRCMYGSRCVRPNMCRCPYGPRGRGCRLRMRFNRRPSTILGRF